MSSSLRQLGELLRPELRKRWKSLLLVLVLAGVSAFGQKAPILLLEPLWNRVLFPATPSVASDATVPEAGSVGWFAAGQRRLADAIFGDGSEAATSSGKLSALWTVATILTVMAILTAVAQYGFTLLSRKVTLRVVVELRMRLARHLMGLSLRYHGQRVFGDLLSRISNDVTTTLSMLHIGVRDLTQQPLLILCSLAVAFYSAPLPTLAVLVFLPLIAVPISILGRRVRRRSTRSLASLGASVEVLTEMFRGIRTVKAFRAEEREMDRYRAISEQYMTISMKMVRALAMIQGSTTFLADFGTALLIVLVGWLSITMDLFSDPGRMMQFFLTISLSYNHIKRTISTYNKVQESAGAAERLLASLAEPVDIAEKPGAVVISSLGRGIRFEGVSLRYPGTDRDALAGVDMEVRPGETLALVGPSGAGKTTFVDLIARFLDPTAGRITAGAHDLRDVSLGAWTDLYAMVGQTPFLFHTTALENIRYGKPSASFEEIVAAAKAANIHDFISSLPEGYETVVGDQGAHLSGGQRQRITIARALLKGAPILLLDEATSSLDSESESVVQEALDRLMENRTVVVIAHRLSTIRGADRIAVLDRGRVVDVGRHEELLARGGLYARLCAVQFAAGAEVPA